VNNINFPVPVFTLKNNCPQKISGFASVLCIMALALHPLKTPLIMLREE
jgi:hypothetical protein